MRIKIRLQFLIARVGFIAFGGEFQLLRDPSPNYRIVAIQTQSEAFAVKHLLANITADETLQLDIRGRPLPCAREQQGHALYLAWADDDMARLAYPPPGQKPVSCKQHCAKQEKMKQRLLEMPLHHHGVYQIGEV
jgi:hypothetical protein